MSEIDDLLNGAAVQSTIATPTLVKDAVDLRTVNVYAFMDDAHDGTGGFRNGTYLIPHAREMFYEERKQLAYYKNFVRPIVRAMVDPVFNEAVVTKVLGADGTDATSDQLEAFLENCDNGGTTLQNFVKRACRKARVHGVSFIVMDNFPAGEIPVSVLDAVKARKIPYLCLRTAAQVPENGGYDCDEYGNPMWILFAEKDDPNDKATPKRWRKWTPEYTVMCRAKGDGFDEIVETKSEHGLGCIPVICLYAASRDNMDTPLVDPPLYDLARMNHALFNKTSLIHSQERSQGFSLLYIQTNNPQNLQTVGDKTVLFIPENMTIPPAYISANPAVLEGLVSNEDKLREDMFRLAEQNGVIGVQSAKSGVAIQWDFFAHESVLKTTSSMAKWLTDKIAELWGLYVKDDAGKKLDAEYPTDFQPNDVTAELALYDKALLMTFPPKTTAMLKSKAVRLLFADEDPQRVQECVDEINQVAEDEINAEKVPPQFAGNAGK